MLCALATHLFEERAQRGDARAHACRRVVVHSEHPAERARGGVHEPGEHAFKLFKRNGGVQRRGVGAVRTRGEIPRREGGREKRERERRERRGERERGGGGGEGRGAHPVSATTPGVRPAGGQLRRCITHLAAPNARAPHPRTIAGSARLSTSTDGRAAALPFNGNARPIAPTSPSAMRSQMLLSVTGPLRRWRAREGEEAGRGGRCWSERGVRASEAERKGGAAAEQLRTSAQHACTWLDTANAPSADVIVEGTHALALAAQRADAHGARVVA
jgi:hypothetical protein